MAQLNDSLGPQVLEYLINSSRGGGCMCGPITVECEACAIAKITRQIRRTSREILERPDERIALYFHNYEEGINSYTSKLILTCRATGYM